MIEFSPLVTITILFAAILVLVIGGMRIGFALMVIGVPSLLLLPPKPLLQRS